MKSPTLRTSKRLVAIAASVGLIMTAFSGPAMAASLSSYGLSASLSGSTVTVKTTITANPGVTASYAGICIRDSSGGNHDLHSTSVWLSSSGTTITKSAQLSAGTYKYWSCARVDGKWTDLSLSKAFTVSGTSTATPTTLTAGSTGQSMPVGNLPGFKQIFTDDFTTNLSRGSFPGSYRNKWASYDGHGDTQGGGVYNSDIISMNNGVMDLYLNKQNGKGQVAAPVPLVNGEWNSQTYGKYTVRFKADAIPGYRTAWLLWPSSGRWSEGEIDFPEGALTGQIMGFNHCVNNPAVNCAYTFTGAKFTSWHTASVEWTPAGVKMFLDGKQVMNSTGAIPKTPMRWVLQTESSTSDTSKMTTPGHLQIDWVTMYDYTG